MKVTAATYKNTPTTTIAMTYQDILNHLQEKATHRIRVFDPRYNKSCIVRKLDLETANSKYGGLDGFFLDLLDKGHKTIVVELMKKHGNTQISVALPGTLELSEKTKDEVGGSGVKPSNGSATNQQQTPTNESNVNNDAFNNPNNSMQNQHSHMFQGMGVPGLGMAELVKASNYDEVKANYQKLEKKCEILEAENKRLEKDNLKYELGIEGKPGALETLLEKLDTETMVMIAKAVSGAKEKFIPSESAAPALNAPNLSEVKKGVINAIASGETTDNTVQLAYQVIHYAKDEQFKQDFITLAQQAGERQVNQQQ